MLNEYVSIVVIKSFTVTAPVNAADAPLVIDKLLMATEVPVIAPVVPASRSKLNKPVMPAPKVRLPPPVEVSVEPLALPSTTALLNN